MAENSKIEWTATVLPNGVVVPGYTFNPWIGCSKVSPGCANCYAERDFDKRRGFAKWGPHGTRVVTSEANWRKPVKWNLIAQGVQAAIPGNTKRPRVFCASLADVFEDWDGPIKDSSGTDICICHACGGKVYYTEYCACGKDERLPRKLTMAEVRRRLFDLIDATPNLDWLLLTKRPENIRRMWPFNDIEQYVRTGPGIVAAMNRKFGKQHSTCHRSNVWLLTSVENQATAEERVTELLKCRNLCPVLGLSVEPLLGPLDLRRHLTSFDYCPEDTHPLGCEGCTGTPGMECRAIYKRELDWIIVGGESGPNARPMHPDWARSIRDQCQAAGVPFFFKQWGEWGPWDHRRGTSDVPRVESVNYRPGCADPYPLGWVRRVGKKAAGRLLDGREWNEFPEPGLLSQRTRKAGE